MTQPQSAGLKLGDIVWVHPQPGRGCAYRARIEQIGEGLSERKVRIRPIEVALSRPAWASTARARWVKIGMISLDEQTP
ncbi:MULTISPECIES: hypothetical protein [unclassified Novosphingobium]|uniref:hypothetical protein n=1 Tax=unclassified Novosphingobium TaxID=2644732 RepID=UPI00146B157F|nr:MULTISPECIES: hypothetical protein [unclassified Novosphingobium]NMN07522.1 hypothetical protein [Novosphingobium sp. SG919]NMN89875.1 hypothetical protein [Novosphingobium sp. SG916]